LTGRRNIDFGPGYVTGGAAGGGTYCAECQMRIVRRTDPIQLKLGCGATALAGGLRK
jgi:hypothetical protein